MPIKIQKRSTRPLPASYRLPGHQRGEAIETRGGPQIQQAGARTGAAGIPRRQDLRRVLGATCYSCIPRPLQRGVPVQDSPPLRSRAGLAEADGRHRTRHLGGADDLPAARVGRITATLTPFANTKFDVGFGEGDGEQADFVWDLEEALAKAKWSQLPWGVHAVGIATILRGTNGRPLAGSVAAQNVEIHLDPCWRQSLLPAATALD